MPRLALAALSLALLATSAAAQSREGDGPPEEAPRGRLFISPAGEPFRGGDGFATWFARADADHDGAITPAEFRADMLRYFKVLDANHDGRLDAFEIQAYERDVVPEIAHLTFDEERPRFGFGGRGRRGGFGGFGGRGGRGDSDFGQGAGRFGLLNIAQPVANADEDVDGRVSLQEWEHAATRRFALLDKTKSGKLTLDALRPAAPKPRK